ncbi:response regulator transcription factor [Sphingobacterium deserti]|uniref:Transcriptional regulator, LuxR family n=1 Tax=Sphingobacterium deserti TaxID=1229276 RepID=A0A0B8T9K4_9SPHI|nr:helix-turn-helix transcriptional regulator [Sphingobacterium deserti]KGE14685.1 transcriptional regulator, LuxR family [Sphingobacterium deserti]
MINRIMHKENRIETLSENELNRVLHYRDVIYAFERAIYSSIYTIDYEKQTFEYVSENPLFLCGLSVDEVREMGYAFYFNNVVPEDLDLLIKANKLWFEFYEKIPLPDKKLYTISYDFHLKNDSNKDILVNHKLTPVFITDSGKIRKAICIVSLSTAKCSGNIKILKKGCHQILDYDLKKDRWSSVKKIVLTEREKEIIQLSIRGFTINEIASQLFVSPGTVKFHRKNIFAKLDVTNMSQGILFAANNKLL